MLSTNLTPPTLNPLVQALHFCVLERAGGSTQVRFRYGPCHKEPSKVEGILSIKSN